VLHEKGTNRSKFHRGEVEKYTWVDVGSSFLPSEITAAFLYGQLENLERIQARRKRIWELYYDGLLPLMKEGRLGLPTHPTYASNNAHLFYILTKGMGQRDRLIRYLGGKGIIAVFHYVPLHKSPFYLKNHPEVTLAQTEYFSDCLVRLPLYFELTEDQITRVIQSIKEFYDGGG